MTLLDDFVRIFQLPPAMIRHVDVVVQGREMELVVILGDGPLTAARVSEALCISPDETEALLGAAYTRHVINREARDGVTTYTAGTFYHRMDPLSMYEKWGDVPAEAREAVSRWQLQEFISIWLPAVEAIRADPEKYVRIPNRDVLLPEEALAMVDAASDHVVVPCDCRSIVMACTRPLETCVRLDEGARLTLERGHGRRLTREEARALVISCHRSGLMHTGDRNWREHGELFGFCNCCACDCYPFRAAQELGMQRQWPRSHFIAERDTTKCSLCGLCVRSCHFEAFHRDGSITMVKGKRRRTVLFKPARCWGCGLCVAACPDGAITLRAIHG